VFEAFTAATLAYLVITVTIVLAMRWLERRVAVPGFIAAGRAPVAGH
jgi:glutamate/aspartate transport system permease protein